MDMSPPQVSNGDSPENPQIVSDAPKKKVPQKIVFLAIGIVIFVLLVIFFLLTKNTRTNDKSGSSSAVPTPIVVKPGSSQVRTAPSVHFDSYTLNTTNPIVGNGIKTYTLKDNYSSSEVASFAGMLGIPSIPAANLSKDVVTASNLDDPNNIGILVFDKKSGTFQYNSFGVLKPKGYTTGVNPVSIATSILTDLGISDPTLVCTNTYQEKDVAPPTVTFIECHRAWNKLGAPLVSFGGMLNVPENTKINQLAVGATYPYSPDNKSIINLKAIVPSATGQDGKARPNDFNTVTVGVYPDGRIFSINSNLRLFEKQSQPITASDVLTPQDALDQFTKQKATLSLTLPAGSGNIDWDKVYPKNMATGKKATILDYELVYLENLPFSTQSSYQPYYLIHGSAKLNSGYTVTFVQVVPALKSPTLSTTSRAVAGAKTYLAQANNNIQLKTYTPVTPTPKRTPTSAPTGTPPGTTPTRTPSSNPIPTINPKSLFSECVDKIGPIITLDIEGYGQMVIVRQGESNSTLFFKSSTFATSMQEVWDAFSKALQDQITIDLARHILKEKIPNSDISAYFATNYNYPDYVKKRIIEAAKNNEITQIANKKDVISGFFPLNLREALQTYDFDYPVCYLTGSSPSLFLYPLSETPVSVTTTKDITYNDPQFSIGNAWNVIAEPNGKVSDEHGLVRNYLYYEYDAQKVVFPNQSSGFVVQTSEWKEFVMKLAQKIGLNQPETEQLVHEVENALVGTPSMPFLKISLVDKDSLEKNLPLQMNPQPNNLYRIHLLLTPIGSNTSAEPPLIAPVKRVGFTAVELGARVSK